MQSDLQADSRQWQLFGLDLARAGRYLRAGWQELLRGDAAGIRKRLDTPVVLHQCDGRQRYFLAEQAQSGTDLSSDPELVHALQLPVDRVLLRRLRLPQVVELELDEVVALEVRSRSPFTSDNTVYGWRIVARSADSIELSLALAARSDVTAWLLEQGGNASPRQPEVWALDEAGEAIVLQGFGESLRQRAYPRRVASLALRLGVILLCVVVLLALPGVVRSLQAARMDSYLARAQADAAEAQELRDALQAANMRVAEFQAIADRSVDHAAILERISRLTPDTVFLQGYKLDGLQLRLTGQAMNAAAYMQLLTEQGGFADVQTPSAFSRDRRTGMERFVLDIKLQTDAAEGGR